MAFTVTMPKLSPTMEEGTIVKWHVQEGAKVQAGQTLIEVATDKATVEYEALDEGFLRKILVKEGEVAKINAPIAVFSETEDEDISQVKSDSDQKEKPEKEEEKAPEKEKTLDEEKKKVESASKTEGLMQPDFPIAPPLDSPTPKKTKKGYIPASPLAKKIAREKGVDLSSVEGTGPKKRVMSRDLDAALSASSISFESKPFPSDPPGSYEEIALSPIRKIVADKLQKAKTFIPHFYIHQELDASSLIQAREELKNFNLKITFNDFVVRACSLALREHPEMNAGFNSKNQTIVLFKTVDISVAVTVEEGLITPIIRNADCKNLAELSVEIKALAKKAKEGTLKPEEFQGGSFTVSNLGMFGISDFVAVINPPQAAILAVGGIEQKPVVKDGQVVVGHTMKMTLSVDHRVVDGAVAAKFLKTIQKHLENTSSLLLG